MNGDFIKVSTTRDSACIEIVKNYKKFASHTLNKNDIQAFIMGIENILFDLRRMTEIKKTERHITTKEQLKEWQTEHKLNNTEASRFFGVSKSTYEKWIYRANILPTWVTVMLSRIE